MRKVLAWLLLITLPLQGATIAWLDAQGPAHTHALTGSSDDDDPDQQRHLHAAIAHHAHERDDPSVRVQEQDEHQHHDAAGDDGGTTSSAQASAVLGTEYRLTPIVTSDRGCVVLPVIFSSIAPRRLERPPMGCVG